MHLLIISVIKNLVENREKCKLFSNSGNTHKFAGKMCLFFPKFSQNYPHFPTHAKSKFAKIVVILYESRAEYFHIFGENVKKVICVQLKI